MSLSLRKEKPDDNKQDGIEDNKYNVVLLGYIRHGNGIDKLADGQANVGREVGERDAGSAQSIRKDLSRVGVQERSEGDVVVEVEGEEHGDHGYASRG